MKTYQVDLDYESYLFDPNYKENSASSSKMIKEFEYVFFLVNWNNKDQCILKNNKKYDENYLNRLRALGFFIPNFDPMATNAQHWWGNRHNYQLERVFNSKITSAEMGLKHGWGFFSGNIVENIDHVLLHLKNFPQEKKWIIKNPDGLSGIGHYVFLADACNETNFKKILTGKKMLLEPWHDRWFDIGTTFVVEDGVIKRQFMVENFNTLQGRFRGGIGASDLNKFKKYIFDKYNYSLDKLELLTQEIASQYLHMGAVNNIQIDSFVYLDNGEVKLYPLVEVNYRKTMGLVIQSLADKYPNVAAVEWIIKTQKELEADKQFLGLDIGNWTKLSPEDTHFKSYYRPIYL